MSLHPYLYLASQSPRRAQLLDQLGVAQELLLPDDKEDAERLARRGWPRAPELCSDTTVALGARILGKPADSEQARQTLALLSGRTR